MSVWAFRSAVLLLLIAACGGGGAPPRVAFDGAGRHLTIEVLGDDLIHFELSGATSRKPAPIPSTPMVARTAFPGPSRFTDDGHGHLATATLALDVDASTSCIAATDLRTTPSRALTRLCPETLGEEHTSLTLSPSAHAYGLGEHFFTPGDANGDLAGRVVAPGGADGNAMTQWGGGFTGNAQFPVLYTSGATSAAQPVAPYALYLDHSRAQTWNLAASPWRVDTSGATLRGYLIAGTSLLDVRSRYMDLVGRPPVPPKRMFGMWVSEFGYLSWNDLEDKLHSLRQHGFPVDGFVLDLFWFGGVFQRPSHMGTLEWDEKRFPDPAAEIARLRDEEGIGIAAIEESYVDQHRAEFAELAGRGDLVLAHAGGSPLTFLSWWGNGGMIDWTSERAGDAWHDEKRQPLADMGVTTHWTDLGEPEEFSTGGVYHGFPALDGTGDRDVHNLYNLAWAASIARGYSRHHAASRPWILSRSGTTGIQRFGASMWSGDIGSNTKSLASSFAAQMNVSFSGIDYFGNDIGGYHREALDGDRNELYTRWFADGMLLDVPGRPHTLDLGKKQPTAPDRIGDPASNLANLQTRYRLVPYLYSLAHRAYLYGEPYEPPLVTLDESDPALAGLADEKLLGPSLLVATLSRYGETARDVYLPAGTWVDFRTQQWIQSTGQSVRDVPVVRDGLVEAPVFARAGAIVPEMFVDDQTMNVLGQRKDSSRRDELVVRVCAGAQASEFTLYEDDGTTVAYRGGAVRTTLLSQERENGSIVVTVAGSAGSYAAAPAARDDVIELAAPELSNPGGATGLTVLLDGASLARRASRTELDANGPGWLAGDDGLVVIRSGSIDVTQPKRFEIRPAPPSP